MTPEDKAREIALKYTQLPYRDRNKWWDDLTEVITQALRDTERRVWLEAAEIAEYYSLPKRALSDSAYWSGGMNTRAGIATALRARAEKGE